MEDNQRQNKPAETLTLTQIKRNTARITRGFSDLPKDQPPASDEEDEEESEEEEQSESQNKTKKIHHMTLKALQRKQKLAELQKAGLIPPQKPVEKQPPRKRGRPKGVKKVQDKDDYQVNFNEVSVEQAVLTPQKKQRNLRKREHLKRIIQPDSQQIIAQKPQDLKNVQVEIQVPSYKPPPPPAPPAVEGGVTAAVSLPTGPKKRGRKKKIQPQSAPATAIVNAPAQKVFTVPKAQTYDNYHRYYNRMVEETKEAPGVELTLIFDKFSDPEGYQQLLSDIKHS